MILRGLLLRVTTLPTITLYTPLNNSRPVASTCLKLQFIVLTSAPIYCEMPYPAGIRVVSDVFVFASFQQPSKRI